MSTTTEFKIIDIEQGSSEWIALRKTKITATDAPVIMECSPWKRIDELYEQKTSEKEGDFITNEAIERGRDLEPIARDLFNIQHGCNVKPLVIVKENFMASLDGIDLENKVIVEIKCPGEKTHAIALQGKVPENYFSQIQHQLYVSGYDKAYYFSFDGMDGVSIEVKRDDEYIAKMVQKELEFYECIINKTPPIVEDKYVERNDKEWNTTATAFQSVMSSIKDLELEAESLREKLIQLSEGKNCKGAGVSLSKYQRRGNIEYGKIPQLKGVDLEQYRKPGTTAWRIA